MKRALDITAACVLAGGFLYACFVALAIEPGMGFRTPADYVNPTLILAGTRTIWWYVGELVYIAIGVACLYLGGRATDRYGKISGVLAGAGFVFIGLIDRALLDLQAYLPDAEQVTTSTLGFLPARLAALRLSALAFGVFAWRLSLETAQPGIWGTLWRGLGFLVLLAGIALVFAFVPTILLLLLWSIGLVLVFAASETREST